MTSETIGVIAITAAVQALVGGSLGLMIQRYARRQEDTEEELRELKEERIAKLDQGVAKTQAEMRSLERQIGELPKKCDCERFCGQVKDLAAVITANSLRQAEMTTKLTIFGEQIEEVFQQLRKFGMELSREQGRLDEARREEGLRKPN